MRDVVLDGKMPRSSKAKKYRKPREIDPESPRDIEVALDRILRREMSRQNVSGQQEVVSR